MQQFKVTLYKDGRQVAEVETHSVEFYNDYGDPDGYPTELTDHAYDRAEVVVVD